MAWNPSPKVADCRDIARKWQKQQVIIIALDDKTIEMATYGETKHLCASAKLLGDSAYEGVMRRIRDAIDKPMFEELPMG